MHVFLPVRQFRREFQGVHVSDCEQTVLRLVSLRESTEAQGQTVGSRASVQKGFVSLWKSQQSWRVPVLSCDNGPCGWSICVSE